MKFGIPLIILLSSWLITASQNIAYKGDIKDVKMISSVEQFMNASKLLVPHIVEWKNKHLISAFEVGIPGKTDMGDIVSMASDNDGLEWKDKVVIFDHKEKYGTMQFAYANPILYKIPGQNLIWCFAMRNLLYQRNSEESALVAAISGDGGRSWNEVPLIMHYSGSLVLAGNILQIVDSTGEMSFLLPAHRNSVSNGPVGGSREHFVLKSKNLLEWEVSGYIPQPPNVWIHEGHIAKGNQANELIIVMRTADTNNKALSPSCAWSSTSFDNGKTWSYPKPEVKLWNSVSEGAFGKTNEGIYYYIYNDGPKGLRKSLKYKIRPPGKEWSEERTFFDTGLKNSYPSVIEVSNGELRIVWDGGTENITRTRIFFGKLSIH